MNQTKKNFHKLITTIKTVKETPIINGDTEITENLITLLGEAKKNLIESMDDDFNTPKAIAEIMTLFRNINRSIIEKNNKVNKKFKDEFFEFVNTVDEIFGIFPDLEKRLQDDFLIPVDEKDKLINSLLELIKDMRNELRTKKIYDLNAISYFSNYGPYIPENKEIRILDIGCGMGHFYYALKKNRYSNYIGIDISSQMIDFLKNKIQNTELKNDFEDISNKIHKLDLFDFLQNNQENFDLIVAKDLIEHIQKNKILQLFQLVKKNLKHNGIFIAKTANMANLVSNMLLYDDFTHEIGFTNLSLAQIYQISGFKNIQVRQFVAKKPKFITRIIRRLTLKFISEIFGVKEIKNWSPLTFGIGQKC